MYKIKTIVSSGIENANTYKDVFISLSTTVNFKYLKFGHGFDVYIKKEPESYAIGSRWFGKKVMQY